MVNHYSRRQFLGAGLSLVLTNPALAGAPAASLRPLSRGPDAPKAVLPSAQSLVQASKLSGRVAFVVADAQTGEHLESLNGTTPVAPASVTKAITALYALHILGAGHRFTTTLMATGPLSNGVLQGDLILAGGGDPTLDTNALADMARQLKAMGLREIRGRFLVYDGALPYIQTIDKDQPDHVGYSPAISGLALNFNRVHFEWRRNAGKYSVAMDARSDKYRPEVGMARMQIVNRKRPVYHYTDQSGIDKWTVARGALGGGGSRWLPVRKPALYAGDVFATMAGAHGIRLKSPHIIHHLPAASTLLHHQSVPLYDILRDMLRYSTNLTAEMVGLAATLKHRGKVNTLAMSAKEMNAWCASALGVTGMQLVDHSGLGAANRMTAQGYVSALHRVYHSNLLQPILKKIPLRDTQQKIIKNAPVQVVAKTGTLNFVSGLGGFIRTAEGKDLVFAIFAGDEAIRARIPKSDREAPHGAKTYNKRAKQLQQRLIGRWSLVYGS